MCVCVCGFAVCLYVLAAQVMVALHLLAFVSSVCLVSNSHFGDTDEALLLRCRIRLNACVCYILVREHLKILLTGSARHPPFS